MNKFVLAKQEFGKIKKQLKFKAVGKIIWGYGSVKQVQSARNSLTKIQQYLKLSP